MSAVLGLAGVKRNASAAVCVDGELLAACEEERLTRVRGVGMIGGALPRAAIDAVTRSSNPPVNIEACVTSEAGVAAQASCPVITLDHHRAHAAAAFLTSPFERAAVIVCDTNRDRELSVWAGKGGELVGCRWPWRGPAFASVYAECARLFGEDADPHALEVEAHLGRGDRADDLDSLFRYDDAALELAHDWRAQLHQRITAERQKYGHARETASAIQRRLGELLLDAVADIRSGTDMDAVCLGGGLFYNTYLNTVVKASGIFGDVFVPANPGNPGLAVGGALLVGGRAAREQPEPLSPFLGPEYDAEAIKQTLDGCKLSYEYVTESQMLDRTALALHRGQLVAWFQGRMEWGHRALGHRSILASPASEYVLDNLNFFLRKRDRSRPFGVAVPAECVADLFCGPSASRHMEFQYRVRDDRLRHAMPDGATAIRVQTVPPEMRLFHTLLERVKQATGVAAVVNTSFNAFQEPIVCSPRDAIRVFFGTGIDMLVMGRFIVTK